MDPEAARLVAGGRHHPALVGRAAAHDDRPAAQLRSVALLDGGKERVEIDVQDGSLGHPAMMRLPGPAAITGR